MTLRRWLWISLLVGIMTQATHQCAHAAVKKPYAPRPRKLLIVAPIAVLSTMTPFVEHKKRLLPTEIIALDTIRKGSVGADDAEKLKRYLHTLWKVGAVGYVLLVGDAEWMPIRYVAVTDVTAGPNHNGVVTAFAPSDLYFSDLAKKDGSFDDWNANKVGINAQYYGQLMGFDGKDPINVDQVDYLPDVALGRWPVHTIAQLQAVIAKTIRYENHVLADDLPAIRRAAFINGPDFMDLRHQMDDWGKKLEDVSRWRPVRRYAKFEDGDETIPTPYDDEVGRIIEDGVGMIFHVGHGGDTFWDACLDLNRVKSLKNSGLPPVMFSIGCSTAMYTPAAPYGAYVDLHGKPHEDTDSKILLASPPPPHNFQRGKFDKSSLGVESFRAPRNGSVAYIGCCVGSQGYAWPMMEGFIEYIPTHQEPRLGDAWAAAVIKYYNVMGIATIKAHDWGEVAIVHQAMKFQLFGDPSMRLPRAPNPAANLLVNGGFEDSPDVKDYLPLDPTSTAIKGWKVTRGQIDLVGNEKAADGKVFVDLHGSPGYGGVAQTFKTTPGRRYRLTFSLAGSNDCEFPNKRIAVSAAGSSREFSFDSTGKTGDHLGWVTKEWEFDARGASTTLEIETLENRDPFKGPYLDNVRVVERPTGK